MTEFLPVGWDNGRVPVPATAVACSTLAAFETELAKYVGGGANDGDSVDIHLSGTSYNEIGIWNYNCTDGGNGLRIYGNPDGSTVVTFTNGSGMAEAKSAVFRIGGDHASTGIPGNDTNHRVSVYNLDLDGTSTGNNGASWGFVNGGAYNDDEWRTNNTDIHFQGCRVRRIKGIGVRGADGQNGTDGVTIKLCTVHDFGLSGQGAGEGIYLGDGSTGRSYDNAVVTQCEVYDGNGEGIEAKRSATNVELSHNLVYNCVINSGGGIKTERPYTVHSNRVHSITADGQYTSDGDGIEVVGGNIYNNIVWGCTGSCITVLKSQNAGDTCTLRHNTLIGGDRAFSFNNEIYLGNNNVTIDSDHNIYNGSHWSGTLNGGSVNDISINTGDFIGSTSGIAEHNGDGPGSSFILTGGSARNAVGTLIVSTDAQGLNRVGPTDAGALDADISAAPAVTFEVTSPADAATDVATPLAISGTCPNDGATDHEVRVYDDTGASVVSDYGDQAVTFTSGTQTFATDASITIPQNGQTLKVRARRLI